MERIKLFKAKPKNWRGLRSPYHKAAWIFGYYVCWNETTYCVRSDYEANPDNTKHCILQESMTDWGLPNDHKLIEIDIDTLSQYTGFDDLKKNQIWENDVVLCESRCSSPRAVLRGESGESSMGYQEIRKVILVDDISNWETMMTLSECEDLTVIGNRFDNPDLMEQYGLSVSQPNSPIEFSVTVE